MPRKDESIFKLLLVDINFYELLLCRAKLRLFCNSRMAWKTTYLYFYFTANLWV